MAKHLGALNGKARPGDLVHKPPKGNPFAARHSYRTCDIGGADSRIIIAAIGTACAANVLLTIGGAQGGRGYMVSVYADGQQHRDYGADNEELEALLLLVIESYRSESEDPYALYGIEERRP
jgi:hypothetical protein